MNLPGTERYISADVPDLVVRSEAMRRLYTMIERMAPATLPVLVLGETGVGKELVARAIHERSARSSGPFVAINCAAIPPSLVESVLFGHERGAFTGASERRPGVFERAHGGSILLDEVGELPLSVQAALLRVLETKRLTRVGGCTELEVDVRVIAATHRDLSVMAAAGQFRSDLLFRLDALSLSVPALRERVEEIEPLVELFLAKARERWKTPLLRLTDDARLALLRYRWPGNVRQLKNVIERAAVVCVGSEIGLDELPSEISGKEVFVSAPPVAATRTLPPRVPAMEPLEGDDPGMAYDERLCAFECRMIAAALKQTLGNQTKAAVLLKLPRRTLTNKIHAFGLAGLTVQAKAP